MKQHLSKEDLFQNLKMLVFKYNENTNKNLHSLFELAVLLHDVETIKKLSEEYHLIDAIQYLKKKDSRIKKNSLIELLILNADYEVIENEVNSGTYINYKDKVGNTPLIKACILNKVDVVKLLLKNGADTHVRLKNSIRLVESVFNLGYQEVLDLLIEYKADNILDEYAFSFFHDLEKHISSKYVAEQFVYEELDAARNGNDDAMHFVDKCGIKEELYIGAMQNSLPEVDGAAGAQQVLHRLFFSIKTNDNHSLATKIRIMAVEKIMNKFPQVGGEDAIIAIWNDDGDMEEREVKAAVSHLRSDAAQRILTLPHELLSVLYGSNAVFPGGRQLFCFPLRYQYQPYQEIWQREIASFKVNELVQRALAQDANGWKPPPNNSLQPTR